MEKLLSFSFNITWIICFICNIHMGNLHHRFHVLLHNSCAHHFCPRYPSFNLSFPSSTFSILNYLTPHHHPFYRLPYLIPVNTITDNNYFVLALCSAQLYSFGETPIRVKELQYENKAQNRQPHVYV